MSAVFKAWMKAANAEEQQYMADRIGSSRNYLYHLAGGFRTASPELAIAIEQASEEMHNEIGKRLPLVFRTDLANACSKCEFAWKCLGKKAIRD